MDTTLVGKTLPGLHCFACAAQHLSFTKAGEAMNLSQSAVSHRIRKLEEQLGFFLFKRLTRQLVLTEEGKRLYSVIQSSLDDISAEIHSLQNQEVGGTLHITSTPSFSSCWLTPRLSDFAEQYPNIFLHLRTRNDRVNFSAESVDLAIYYGKSEHPGLVVTPFMDEKVLPVCSRDYADRKSLWGAPQALASCTLLHDAQPWPNAQYFSEWKSWLDFAGLNDIDYEGGHSFDRAELASAWAMQGGGVAMGRLRLVQDQLESGELVAPFEMDCTASQSYYLVSTQERSQTTRVAALCEWLLQQAQQQA
ncbi:DNA-binding transcriptional regulator DsdC [Marinobacterium iners]|uniref:LysR family transcriptional regulator, D-serine deaminase activator n=1 Tax=Marinobacterium iners DSM 11526 TaxID=1122198 RepID=A0A1H3X2X0_9GAMM|nr:DNA-binding transcriptional regulator DsdC [Marinobacterium iners]SDZ93331.1 LysR family transcriptional regulator, D-serine deaminase activator [Marinobacterium iners DSM 11526]